MVSCCLAWPVALARDSRGRGARGLTPVRQALNAQPVNLSHLILALSYHLFTLLPSPLFPTSSSNSSQQNITQEALNCLRVLGRVLVVVYENDAERKSYGLEGESFAQTYLWKRQPEVAPGPTGEPSLGADTVQPEAEREATQFEIGDDDDDEDEDEDEDALGDIGRDEGARAFKATIGHPRSSGQDEQKEQTAGPVDDPLSRQEETVGEAVEEEATGPCLVDRLFSCTIDLLFCAGFTVPESVKGEGGGEKINVSWREGVGSIPPPPDGMCV